ncbi:MAG: hypothetical protein CMM94_07365 [Rickettsiales bacterium]|nr:hypothetical protein [Rickettsiales bacterium]
MADDSPEIEAATNELASAVAEDCLRAKETGEPRDPNVIDPEQDAAAQRLIELHDGDKEAAWPHVIDGILEGLEMCEAPNVALSSNLPIAPGGNDVGRG